MWNENKYLLSWHILKMWNEDLDNRLKVLHKLTHDHIALTPLSTICVRYATQALSNTMATVLKAELHSSYNISFSAILFC